MMQQILQRTECFAQQVVVLPICVKREDQMHLYSAVVSV